MKRNICKIIFLSALLSLSLVLSGCDKAENNAKKEDAGIFRVVTQYKETNKSLADNAVDIFREYYSEQNKNENMIMSPSSLQSAMGLLLDAANEGSATLSELEDFYGIDKADTEVLLSNLMSTQYNDTIENSENMTRDEKIATMLEALKKYDVDDISYYEEEVFKDMEDEMIDEEFEYLLNSTGNTYFARFTGKMYGINTVRQLTAKTSILWRERRKSIYG